MKIFFSAGEPSGDLHGANLIRALCARQADVECVGFGGPKMAEAGCKLHADLTALAVMWLLRALLNLHKFLSLVRRADRYFRDARPDAVVLIDYPGFNWWIARRAKARGIPVFYYSPPQIWAWASWRVKKVRRFIDHVLCGLPFEAEWYNQRGCQATFVGHPYFDEVRARRLDQDFLDEQVRREGPLVALLPGSRTQEVVQNLPMFLKAAEIIRRQRPDARFAIASFKASQAVIAREMVRKANLPVEIFVKRTPELIELADACMAVSGSVSLELLYHAKPTVVLYKISRFAYFVQRWFRKVKYITLVNLLTADELYPRDLAPYDPESPADAKALFPEYLTCQDQSPRLAAHVLNWLEYGPERKRIVRELVALKMRVAHGGAARRASEFVLGAIAPPSRKAAAVVAPVRKSAA